MRAIQPVIAADHAYLNDATDTASEVDAKPILVTRPTHGWTSSHIVSSNCADPCEVLVREGDLELALVALKNEVAIRAKQKDVNVKKRGIS